MPKFKMGYEFSKRSKWREEFDYLSEEEFDEMTFVPVKGWVYPLDQFMRNNFTLLVKTRSEYKFRKVEIHGTLAESAFSGIGINLWQDGEGCTVYNMRS